MTRGEIKSSGDGTQLSAQEYPRHLPALPSFVTSHPTYTLMFAAPLCYALKDS